MFDLNGTFRPKKQSFTQVPNIIARDKTVTHGAKGLYLLIQSYITIPNFIINKTFLIKQSVEGKEAFNTNWEELKQHGYLKQYKINSNKGFIYQYELLDEPDNTTQSTIYARLDDNNNIIPLEIKVQNPRPGSPRPGSPRRGTPGSIIIHNINNTDKNNIISNQSIYDEQNKKQDMIDMIDKNTYNTYESLVKNNIEYDILMTDSDYDSAKVEELTNLIIDTLCGNSPTVRVGKQDKQRAIVTAQLLKLNSEHIKYVLNSLEKNTTKINNIKAYLLTTLYSAPLTMESELQARFNHDMKG